MQTTKHSGPTFNTMTTATAKARVHCLIDKGLLNSPKTGDVLFLNKAIPSQMISQSGEVFPFVNGVPILFANEAEMLAYSNSEKKMVEEYIEFAQPTSSLRKFIRRIGEFLRADFRSVDVQQALGAELECLDQVVLSIGGGPGRPHPNLINLNISPFANVDVVADAHRLPFGDNSILGIFCEAVLEHLSDPGTAVKEMYRVLKPDGRVFCATPFLQAYHGYPSHFQNFTLTGHDLLFKTAGFRIESSGSLIGPGVCLHDFITRWLQEMLPGMLSKILVRIWMVLGYPLRAADLFLNKKPNAFKLSSANYVIVQK